REQAVGVVEIDERAALGLSLIERPVHDRGLAILRDGRKRATAVARVNDVADPVLAARDFARRCRVERRWQQHDAIAAAFLRALNERQPGTIRTPCKCAPTGGVVIVATSAALAQRACLDRGEQRALAVEHDGASRE